jgi:prephenate dehydrogenase
MVLQYLKDRVRMRVHDIDPTKTRGLAEASSLEETLSCQVVIVCVPISRLRSVCSRMAPHLSSGQLVLDTCSVKARPVEWMIQSLPNHVEILGTHPLFGPDSGKDGIAGLRIALCPVRIAPAKYRYVCDFLRSLELVILEVTPEEHDRQIALSQAIFHLIAQAMGRLGWGVKPISTPGPESFFRLVRTVQRDTDQLFLDIERENPYAAEVRRRFIQEILKIDENLRARQDQT